MYLFSNGSGYPVLFIHGMPTSSSLWTGVIDRLCDRFTCLAVDLPGLGRSPGIPYGPKQLEVLAQQIEQIRIERNIEKWHVVGHDAGSAVAVHYAFLFQDRVERLALLSPAMFPELKPFSLFRLLRIPVIGELLAPAVNAIFWNIAMRYALKAGQSPWKKCVDDFREPFSGLRGGWRLMSVLRFGEPGKLLAAVPAMLPEIHVPTLIFHGAQDRAIPQDFALRASALIPQSQVVVVDSGHFLPLNNPETISSELLLFFGAGVAPSSN
jgi:pimeloyl-ACP methyl ester carboxylesterase